MIGLAVLAASIATTAFVLVASGLVALRAWWVRRSDRGPGGP